MASVKKRYRRTSITTVDGRKGSYDAHVETEVDPDTRRLVYRIYSKVIDKCVTYRATGNTAEDHEHVEQLCQKMYEFDSRFGVKPAPKPPKSDPPAVAMPLHAPCPMCGGDGYTTDEDGYEHTCRCRL